MGTNRWIEEHRDHPDLGARYDERFTRLAASGVNVHGEADLVSTLVRPRARVLDAGCGTGRVGVELARRGFDVVGVDLDPSMLTVARTKAPGVAWVQADLADANLDLADPASRVDRQFDLIVAAGNVMIFLAPGTEPSAIANLSRHLAPEGLLVAGFQLGEPGRLSLTCYDRYCAAVGLSLIQRWSTWERSPWAEGASYAVSVHRPIS